MTDADYDYILEEIGWRYKIEFERETDVYSYDMEDWWDHFKWILYVLIIYSLYHNNFISSFLGLKFVFRIWIGKQIHIITFNLSYKNTNDYDCVLGDI